MAGGEVLAICATCATPAEGSSFVTAFAGKKETVPVTNGIKIRTSFEIQALILNDLQNPDHPKTALS